MFVVEIFNWYYLPGEPLLEIEKLLPAYFMLIFYNKIVSKYVFENMDKNTLFLPTFKGVRKVLWPSG